MGLLTVASWTAKCITIVSILSVAWLYRYSKASDNVDTYLTTGTTTSETPQNQRCEDVGRRFLLLASSLDGQLSALDLSRDGQLSWTLQTGTKGLLSSSITNKIEFSKDGKNTRLIPSLDGGLYRFNGETIEAIPYNADKLLSSSFVLDEDLTIVGGKEIKSYGVDARTGQVHYVCGLDSDKCEMCSDREILDSDDIIVVKRRTQTVRAKEMRSGYEKWNFSVGQLELKFLEGTHQGPVMTDDEDVVIETCYSPDDDIMLDNQYLDLDDIKVSVSPGIVTRMHPTDSGRIMWTYKSASPVAHVWVIQDGSIQELNLFDNRHLPSMDQEKIGLEGIPGPLLYIGVHQKQMYVQPSVQLTEDVHSSAAQRGVVTAPKVKWRPYLATAPSRTPWLSEHCDNPASIEETGLALWNYPYDNGFYLFSDNCRQNKSPMVTIKGHNGANLNYDDYAFHEVIPITLWNWWKEILVIVFLTMIVTLFCSSRLIKHVYRQRYLSQQSHDVSSSILPNCLEEIHMETMATMLPQLPHVMEYSSRYVNDFEQVQCLGRGGFGVVFEAKNNLDDCHYAIKRISLPNRPESKEKVMREVKALAKLDHVNIVRYFQSWIEQPPGGWQEDRDHEWDDSEGLTPTPCNSVQDDETSEESTPLKVEIVSSSLDEQSHGDSNQLRRRVLSKSPRSKLLLETQTNNDSFDIQFVDSDSEQNNSNANNVPFQSYQHKFNDDTDTNLQLLDESLSKIDDVSYDHTGSFNIVFEESGAADKSSNADSVICDDHLDHLEDLTNGSRESVNLSISPKSFSLSSHGRKFVRRNSNSEPNLHVVVGRLWKTSPGNTFEEFDESFSKNTRNTQSEDIRGKQHHDKNERLFLYIQMQLCRRESLKDWLNANTLNRNRNNCLDVFDQIVSAMEYVHDMGLMHRDLKPSNIFFSLDGIIKIGDFGLVTAMAEYDDSRYKSQLNKKSKHTDQVGTQLYMSPEQIAGKPYNYKVDIFAMGLIFFELVYPFSTQMERVRTLVDVRRNIFPERFSRELPTECMFVKRLLARNPSDRPDVSDIQDSDLLRNYEPPKPIRKHRTRTKSSSSGDSAR